MRSTCPAKVPSLKLIPDNIVFQVEPKRVDFYICIYIYISMVG